MRAAAGNCLHRKRNGEMVHEMLDTLPDDQRMCILMFHFEGAGIREIAETMECSENTVKSPFELWAQGN